MAKKRTRLGKVSARLAKEWSTPGVGFYQALFRAYPSKKPQGKVKIINRKRKKP